MGETSEKKTTKVTAKDLGVKQESTQDVVNKTVETVMASIAPYLQNNMQQPTPKKADTVSDVRSRVIRDMEAQFQKTLKANKNFANVLANLKPKDYTRIRIPRVYKKYFGPYLPVGINGIIITVPIDNNYHKIPKLYLPIIEKTLRYEDEKIDFMERTDNSDITFTTRETLGT